jgi:hypothetical protein
MKFRRYYCWTDNEGQHIEKKKPENFDKLKNNYFAFAPTRQVAKMAYVTFLKNVKQG